MLPEEERQKLALTAADNARVFSAGELIYSPAEFRKALGLVIYGSVNVTRRGDKTVLLNRLTDGGIFGAAALFGDSTPATVSISSDDSTASASGIYPLDSTPADGSIHPSDSTPATVSVQPGNTKPSRSFATEIRAVTPVTVWFVEGETVREYVRKYPDFAEAYIIFLSERIRFLNARIVDFTAQCADAKLAGYLLRRISEGSAFISRVNMSAVARSLDIGRASLYRSLDNLEEKGLIRKAENTVEVVDPEGLRLLAGAG